MQILNRLDPATTEKLVYAYSKNKMVAACRDSGYRRTYNVRWDTECLLTGSVTNRDAWDGRHGEILRPPQTELDHWANDCSRCLPRALPAGPVSESDQSGPGAVATVRRVAVN